MSGWGLIATFGLLAPAGKGETPADEIVGEWVVQSVSQGGKTVPASRDPNDRWVIRFARDGIVAWLDRDGKDHGEPGQTYTVDAAARPARIDWTTAPPRGSKKVGLGIYKVEGDQLTLAVAFGADRPARFGTSLADSTTVFVLKRADKGKD